MSLVPLAPSPAAVFPSREQLVDATQSWAAPRGYAVATLRSDEYRMSLKCDRGGVYRNQRNLTDATRQRQSAKRQINCPFRLHGARDRTLIAGRFHLSTPTITTRRAHLRLLTLVCESSMLSNQHT
jgi:hypothetical protein